jgi:hypothetical protein
MYWLTAPGKHALITYRGAALLKASNPTVTALLQCPSMMWVVTGYWYVLVLINGDQSSTGYIDSKEPDPV